MGYSTIQQDEQHLKLLSIFHYVLAAIVGLFACFPIIHLIIGIAFLVAPEEMIPQPPVQPPGQLEPGQQPGQPVVPQQPPFAGPPTLLFGLMFTIIPAIIILMGWAMAGLIFYAGRCLARRTHYTFCLVVAGIACLNMPLGTILGVFTIIVLVRPSVHAMFQNRDLDRLNL